MHRLRLASAFLAGVLAGAVLVEATLRAVQTPALPPRPHILADSLHAGAVTRRQIEEGVAVSHFSSGGARLTGSPEIDEAPIIIVLGDSYVVAEQVGDATTMGGRLERLAREAGVPINVRQYGWSGASPGQYVYAAPDLRARWKPRHVFVTLADNDIDREVIIGANPRVTVDGTNTLRIVDGPIHPFWSDTARSSLLTLLRHRYPRFQELMARLRAPGVPPGVPPAPLPLNNDILNRLPGATVRALKAAYGDSLTIVYLASPYPNEFLEDLLSAACIAATVDCVSTRSAMVTERSRGRMAHGASTSTPGNGHLNAVGHRIAGDAMWQALQKRVRGER